MVSYRLAVVTLVALSSVFVRKPRRASSALNRTISECIVFQFFHTATLLTVIVHSTDVVPEISSIGPITVAGVAPVAIGKSVVIDAHPTLINRRIVIICGASLIRIARSPARICIVSGNPPHFLKRDDILVTATALIPFTHSVSNVFVCRFRIRSG